MCGLKQEKTGNQPYFPKYKLQNDLFIGKCAVESKIKTESHRKTAGTKRNRKQTPQKQKPLESYLATAGIPDPDLLIRTGGEQRISNYMLWQCAYTEFYFTDKLWPDFREDDFNEALDCFSGRDRRFGKVKQ